MKRLLLLGLLLTAGLAGWASRTPDPGSEAVRRKRTVGKVPPPASALPVPKVEPLPASPVERAVPKDAGVREGKGHVPAPAVSVREALGRAGGAGSRERLKELLKLKAEQERFLQDLPVLTAAELERFREWEKSWETRSLWTWPYDDDFANRLARRLRETLLAFPPDPAIRRPLASEVLWHWRALDDSALKDVQSMLASESDPDLRNVGRQLDLKIRHRRVDRESAP